MKLRLERLPEVEERTGRSAPSIWRDVREGRFPKPVRIGPNAVAWPSPEVDAWIEARIAERDKRGA